MESLFPELGLAPPPSSSSQDVDALRLELPSCSTSAIPAAPAPTQDGDALQQQPLAFPPYGNSLKQSNAYHRSLILTLFHEHDNELHDVESRFPESQLDDVYIRQRLEFEKLCATLSDEWKSQHFPGVAPACTTPSATNTPLLHPLEDGLRLSDQWGYISAPTLTFTDEEDVTDPRPVFIKHFDGDHQPDRFVHTAATQNFAPRSESWASELGSLPDFLSQGTAGSYAGDPMDLDLDLLLHTGAIDLGQYFGATSALKSEPVSAAASVNGDASAAASPAEDGFKSRAPSPPTASSSTAPTAPAAPKPKAKRSRARFSCDQCQRSKKNCEKPVNNGRIDPLGVCVLCSKKAYAYGKEPCCTYEKSKERISKDKALNSANG